MIKKIWPTMDILLINIIREEYKMDYEYLDYLVEKYRERNEIYYTESSSNMIWAVAGGAIIAL